MSDEFGDARLEELTLLSRLDHIAGITIRDEVIQPGPIRDMIACLINAGYVNDLNIDWQPDGNNSFALPGESPLERQLHCTRMESLSKVLSGQPAYIQISHRGRVRLSELKHVLRSGRDREPFGILWEARHWEQDLHIAILESGIDSPVAVAYLDMNGLKHINDTRGHDAGDLALKAYFHAVISAVGDQGQAYRLSGGADEVLVVLPKIDKQNAIRIIKLACSKLMHERLWLDDANIVLSIAAGITICTDSGESPIKLRSTADDEQKKAKEESKKFTYRPSTIALEREKEIIVIPLNA